MIKNSYSQTYAIKQRASIDLSLSENPLGHSPKVTEAIINAAGKLSLYPTDEKTLITSIAQHHNIAEERILLGAGANQLLEDFLKVFALRKNIVVPSATFPESVACMATLQGSVNIVSLQKNLSLDLDGLLNACTSNTGLIHLCNPNNPTGIWTAPQQLLELAQQSPVPILISEASAEFIRDTSINSSFHSNLMIVRSFSKAYGLAGLRVGYCVASVDKIAILKSQLRSYRVSSIALVAAIAALQDQEHLQKSIAYLLQEKAWLMREMSTLGFKIVPSQGPSFIAQVPKSFDCANHFCTIAKQYDTAVVNCSIYPGLEAYIRISPQIHSINHQFILTLKKILGEK